MQLEQWEWVADDTCEDADNEGGSGRVKGNHCNNITNITTRIAMAGSTATITNNYCYNYYRFRTTYFFYY